MHMTSFLFGGLILSLGTMVHAQCSMYIPVHEIISAPRRVLSIEDESGSREVKAELYNSADCDVNPLQPTGQQFADNYTLIAQKSTDANGCEIKDIGGVLTMDSIQAVKITTNGWTMDDLNFNFDDLDASHLGWREVMGVIGMRDGAFVTPVVTIESVTNLALKTYRVSAATANFLGVGSTPFDVPGAQYVAPGDINCPFEDSIESRQCRANIQFSGSLDTLLILYSVLERGSLDSQSGAFFSELRMNCACRCRQTNPGTRMTFSPVPGLVGECVQRQISSPRSECDVLGDKWCTKQEMTDYTLSGGLLPSGNYGCTSKAGSKVAVVDDFAPVSGFGPTV